MIALITSHFINSTEFCGNVEIPWQWVNSVAEIKISFFMENCRPCISLYVTVIHNTAWISSDNLPSQPPDKHHSSDVVWEGNRGQLIELIHCCVSKLTVCCQDEIQRDKRVTWLIEFYAAWSPQCAQFAPTFSEMSAKYVLFSCVAHY